MSSPLHKPTSSGWTKILSTLGMALGTTLAAAVGTETAKQVVSGLKKKGDEGSDPEPEKNAPPDATLKEEVARLRRESDAARARADRLELELAELRQALGRSGSDNGGNPGPGGADTN
jgi:hypothetical protein